MSRLDAASRRANVFVGLWLWSIAIVLSGFGSALMTADQIIGPLATVTAAMITATAVLIGAWLAWKSIQDRIELEESLDKRKFQSAVAAELVTFSFPVIRGASDWNARAQRNPTEVPTPEKWPILPRPSVYEALVSRIGSVEPWVASAVIAFYGALLDLREMSTEAMHGRATLDVNARAIAERFRHMALNLADALDGLGKDRPFLHSQDFRKLFMPNGESVASIKPLPMTLQELLRAVGGQASQKPDAIRIG